MSYVAAGLFAVAIGLMALDLAGLTPGAAGLSNVALLGAFVAAGAKGLASLRHHWHEAHHPGGH